MSWICWIIIFNSKKPQSSRGYITLMDMIEYNLVAQMDWEAPFTKPNWMCELSSWPRTKQLPSLHYKEELISILTSSSLIHLHILFSSTPKTASSKSGIFQNSGDRKEMLFTIMTGWKSQSEKLHGLLINSSFYISSYKEKNIIISI